jgi:hypothetical protein
MVRVVALTPLCSVKFPEDFPGLLGPGSSLGLFREFGLSSRHKKTFRSPDARVLFL